MALFPFLATNFSFFLKLGMFIGTIWIMFVLSYRNEKLILTTNFWCNLTFTDNLYTLVRRQCYGGIKTTNPRIWWCNSHPSDISPVSWAPLTHDWEPRWSLSCLSEYLGGQAFKDMLMECQKKGCLWRGAAVRLNSLSTRKTKEDWLLS